jgi:hypothetical protein
MHICSFVLFCSITFLCFSQLAQRKTIYTLQRNEIIYFGEAVLSVQNNSSNYCLIVEDTMQQQYSLVLNGKKVHTQGSDAMIWMKELNLENQTYVLQFWNERDSYLNINGVTYGPYEEIYPMVSDKTGEIGYFYKLGSKYYMKTNERKYGPFINDHSGVLIAESQTIFYRHAFTNSYSAVISGQDLLELHGKEITLNGKIIKSEMEGNFSKLTFESLSNYGYIWEKGYGSPNYLCLNGSKSVITDFNYYDFFYIDKSNFFYSTSSKNLNKDYGFLRSIHRNHKVIYNNIETIIGSNNGDLFLFEDANHTVFLNNQKVFYDADATFYTNGVIESQNAYAFIYQKGDDYYVKSSSGQFGPYQSVENLKYLNGKLQFTYTLNNIYYSYNNGTVLANENILMNFENQMENSSLTYENHNFESSYEYDYVVIDGDAFGKSPALQSWIDPVGKKFIWTALENNEYVVYSYPIK